MSISFLRKDNKLLALNFIPKLLVILNVLFLIYYINLSYYSRYHYDDFHFLWKLREMSIGEYVKDMYLSRSGRFFAYFINGVIYKTILLSNEHRFFPLLFYIFGISICLYSWNIFFKSISFLQINIIIIFYNIYVLTNIDFAVFSWLCAMSYYLLGPMLLLIICIILKRSFSAQDAVLLTFLSIALGGGQEAFTPIVLIQLGLLTVLLFQEHEYKMKGLLSDIRFRKSLYSLIVIFFCFLVLIIAPGNYARMESDEFNSPISLLGYIRGYGEALTRFFYFFSFYLPYYFFLFICFIFVGLHTKNIPRVKLYRYKKLMIVSTLVYLLYLLISLFPNVYLWGGFGIQRNYTHVVFFTILFTCFQAFLIGYYKKLYIKTLLIQRGIVVGILLGYFIMIFNISIDSGSAKNYALSVDERIMYLKHMNALGRAGTVVVEPLSVPYTLDPKYFLFKLLSIKKNPQPVLYYISDTDTLPNEYALHLTKYYKFNFMIKFN